MQVLFSYKTRPLPPMWQHTTPEYHDLANLILPNYGQHYIREQWLEQYEFSLSEVSFTQVLAFLVKHFLSQKLHFVLSKNIFHPKKTSLSPLSLFLSKPRDTHTCKCVSILVKCIPNELELVILNRWRIRGITWHLYERVYKSKGE